MAAPSWARGACTPVVPGESVSVAGGIAVACGTTLCRVLHGRDTLVDVALARSPLLCDATDLQPEEPIPSACAKVLSRTGLSLRQTLEGPERRSETVIDVLEPVPGIAWKGDRGPLATCLPRYAEKRGDVWQYAWRGDGEDYVFQAFEEDEAPSGKGNSRRAHVAPPRPMTSSKARQLTDGGGRKASIKPTGPGPAVTGNADPRGGIGAAQARGAPDELGIRRF